MYATNFFEEKILNLARGANIDAPGKMYIGLFLNNPTDTGSGTEVSYLGYTRKEINFGVPSISGQNVEIKNNSVITFSESVSDVGEVKYIGIFDAMSGGNMWLYGQLTQAINIQTGVSPTIRTNMIRFTMSGNMSIAYKQNVLNLLRNNSVSGFTPYLALYNGNPESGGIEFTGEGYQRVAITFGIPSEQSNGNSQISNSSLILTPEPTVTWGQLTHIAIMTSSINSSIFMVIPLNNSYLMSPGTICQFQVGKLKININ